MQNNMDNYENTLSVSSGGLLSAPCPINHLPFEILAKIFRWTALHSLVECQHDRHRPQDLEAPFVLTKVCSHWAEIASSTPYIWTRLCSEFTMSRFYSCLERSADHPLDIVIHHSSSFESSYFPLAAFPHAHRYRTLAIRDPYSLQWVADNFSHLSAPLLEEFSLGGKPQSWPSPPQAIVLFEDYAPRLRRLTLDSSFPVTISWDSSILRNLSYLSISDTNPSAAEGDDWSLKYHNLLCAVPLIQEVDISSTGKSGVHSTPEESPLVKGLGKVSLPNLTSVKLKGLPLAVVFTILSFISAPLTSHISISASQCSWTSSFPRDQLAEEGSLLSLVSSVPTKLSILPQCWRSESKIMALSEPTTLSGKARAWSFDLSVKGQTHYPFFTTLLPETSGSTPLNLLGLEGELVFTKPVFIRRLHLFDRVEVLSLSAFSQEKRTTHSKLGIIGLLYYLYTPTRAATETSQVEWAFPKLKRLQLRDMILPATTLELFIRVRCPINPIANAPSPLEVLSIVTCCLNGQNSDKTSVISTINLAGKRLGWEELVQRECNCPEMPPLNGVGCLNSSGEQLVFCSELM